MPIFLEKFLIALCVAAFAGLVIFNILTFGIIDRIGTGLFIVGSALVLGNAVHKYNETSAPELEGVSSPNVSQTGQNNIAQIGNNNQAKIVHRKDEHSRQ